ncbi:MAG: hypothetical protein GY906_22725 [bacterium]|nr:hypothetical protein [bacterium]
MSETTGGMAAERLAEIRERWHVPDEDFGAFITTAPVRDLVRELLDEVERLQKREKKLVQAGRGLHEASSREIQDLQAQLAAAVDALKETTYCDTCEGTGIMVLDCDGCMAEIPGHKCQYPEYECAQCEGQKISGSPKAIAFLNSPQPAATAHTERITRETAERCAKIANETDGHIGEDSTQATIRRKFIDDRTEGGADESLTEDNKPNA